MLSVFVVSVSVCDEFEMNMVSYGVVEDSRVSKSNAMLSKANHNRHLFRFYLFRLSAFKEFAWNRFHLLGIVFICSS